MTEPYEQGPGYPVPSQSQEERRIALRGEFLETKSKKKRRWFNIKRKDYKDRAVTPVREAVIDAENRIEQYDNDLRKAGDKQGHPFRGNQYTESKGAEQPADPKITKALKDVESKTFQVMDIGTGCPGTIASMSDPVYSVAQCGVASDRIAAHLVDQGIKDVYVREVGAPPKEDGTHFVVQVGRGPDATIIDYTFRQFDAGSSWPIIASVSDYTKITGITPPDEDDDSLREKISKSDYDRYGSALTAECLAFRIKRAKKYKQELNKAGEKQGHPFRGNQYTKRPGQGRPSGSLRPRFVTPSEFPDVGPFGDRQTFQEEGLTEKVDKVCSGFIDDDIKFRNLVMFHPEKGRVPVPDSELKHEHKCRVALKERVEQAISKRMAEDPEFIEWYESEPSTSSSATYNVMTGKKYTIEEIATISAAKYTDSWAISAGDHSSMSWALQRCASELFGTNEPKIPTSLPEPDFAEPIENDIVESDLKEDTERVYNLQAPIMKAYLRACYAETQEVLAKNNITSMRLCRGFNYQLPIKMESGQLVTKDESANPYRASVGVAKIASNPLTSWSTSMHQADSFAGDFGAIVMSAEVPADRILSIPCTGPGCFMEDEVVVIGAEGFPVNVTPGAYMGPHGSGGALKSMYDTQGYSDLVKKDSVFLYIDEQPQDDWPKRTPDLMSDLKPVRVAKAGDKFNGTGFELVSIEYFGAFRKLEPLSKAAMKSLSDSIQDINTKKLDKLVREEITRQSPALRRALNRTVDTLLSSKEMRSLIRDLMNGKYTNWQTRLENAAQALYVNPVTLAEALQVPFTSGFAMPQQAMPKTIDYSMQFEQPDILASKWAYSHAGKMIVTQTKNVVDTISQSVTDAMLGDKTVYDLSWELQSVIKLPPRYAQAVRNYRKNLIASGKKVSVANKLSEAYARRLLRSHAETIARTEVMTALAEGQAQHWDQMVQSGVLVDTYVQRKWVTARDERVCAVCGPLDRTTVPYRGQFPITRNGQTYYVEKTPAHPRCRCSIVLDVADPLDLLRQRKKS